MLWLRTPGNPQKILIRGKLNAYLCVYGILTVADIIRTSKENKVSDNIDVVCENNDADCVCSVECSLSLCARNVCIERTHILHICFYTVRVCAFYISFHLHSITRKRCCCVRLLHSISFSFVMCMNAHLLEWIWRDHERLNKTGTKTIKSSIINQNYENAWEWLEAAYTLIFNWASLVLPF